MGDICHYRVLRLLPSASAEEVRAAYHARALACHPDKGGAAPAFLAVQRAWEVLGDAALRAEYDAAQQLAAAAGAAAAPVVSEEVRVSELVAGSGGAWSHACRCGEAYAVTQAQLQGEVDLVINCSGCSLNIRLLQG